VSDEFEGDGSGSGFFAELVLEGWIFGFVKGTGRGFVEVVVSGFVVGVACPLEPLGLVGSGNAILIHKLIYV
jgi:hypothetical protein